MMEALMEQMEAMMDERMGTLAITWEQRMVETVIDTQREHMEETVSQVLKDSCENTGVTFGWKDTVTDPAGQGSGGTQRADCSGRGGQGQGASAEDREDPLEKTMVQVGFGTQRPGEERTGGEDDDMEEGEPAQDVTQSQFADSNIFASLDERNTSKSRSRGEESAQDEVAVVSKAMRCPDGSPAATVVVQPSSGSERPAV